MEVPSRFQLPHRDYKAHHMEVNVHLALGFSKSFHMAPELDLNCAIKTATFTVAQ